MLGAKFKELGAGEESGYGEMDEGRRPRPRFLGIMRFEDACPANSGLRFRAALGGGVREMEREKVYRGKGYGRRTTPAPHDLWMKDDGRRKLLLAWKLRRLDAQVACPICNGLQRMRRQAGWEEKPGSKRGLRKEDGGRRRPPAPMIARHHEGFGKLRNDIWSAAWGSVARFLKNDRGGCSGRRRTDECRLVRPRNPHITRV